jgi:3' terminal RNA ribose 2'-O-methyltransferase Hen1
LPHLCTIDINDNNLPSRIKLTEIPQNRAPESSSDLHSERFDVVVRTLLESSAESVLDLGCGAGELLVRLIRERQFSKIVGIDTSEEALVIARSMVAQHDNMDAPERVSILHASYTAFSEDMAGFDAALMVETIEHIHPQNLSAVEKAVFTCCKPRTVIITTPNQEYNVLYGLPEGTLRHPGHRFEWTRTKFRNWAAGVADRTGYRTSFDNIGPHDPLLGSSTQMVTFKRI